MDPEAAKHKGIQSPVAGQADILLMLDIEGRQYFGKSLSIMGMGKMADLIFGAANPVIVTSRADSHEAKIMSIALGALLR